VQGLDEQARDAWARNPDLHRARQSPHECRACWGIDACPDGKVSIALSTMRFLVCTPKGFATRRYRHGSAIAPPPTNMRDAPKVRFPSEQVFTRI